MQGNSLFIGVDLGGTNVDMGIVNTSGQVCAKRIFPAEIEEGEKKLFDKIAFNIIELQKCLKGSDFIGGIGVGIAGLVNSKDGVLQKAFNLKGWLNVPVKDNLEKRTGYKVFVDNDANLAALGESMFGAGKGVENLLTVTLGSGVGGGLILNGRIFHGKDDGAGEIGHTIIDRNGPLCTCGRRGCVEAFVGKHAIIRSVREKFDKYEDSILKKYDLNKLSPKDVSSAALMGDKLSIDVMTRAGEALGVGAANAANLLGLERIVIGGGLANAGDLILKPAREKLKEIALKPQSVEIVRAALGEDAGFIGAAALAIMKMKN